MYAERRAQISLYEGLRDMFEDNSVWTTPFTVYGRQDWTPSFSGEFPWVFIVNADPHPEFQIQHLPVIVIETDMDVFPLEVGGAKYAVLKFAYHIFADSGAQRDDLAGSIIKHQTMVTVKDYDQATPPVLETHTFMPNSEGAIWTQSPVTHSPFSPEWYSEYLRYGRILSSAFELINL